MQNRAGPTCEIRSWSTSPFGNSFLEFFRGNFFFSEPPNIFQAALSGPVRMVWSAPVTVGWGAEHSQPLLAGPTCEISSSAILYPDTAYCTVQYSSTTVIWIVVSYSYVLYSTIPGHVYRIAHMATPAPRCSCCYAQRKSRGPEGHGGGNFLVLLLRNA